MFSAVGIPGIHAGEDVKAEAFGLPLVYDPSAPWNIAALGIDSAEIINQPAVVFYKDETASGFASHFSRPSKPAQWLFAVGIASREAFGQPSITPGVRSLSRRRREEAALFDL